MRDSPQRSNLPESHEIVLSFSGGNGADLTLVEGLGVSATCVRTGEGAYDLKIAGGNPGEFKGWTPSFGAATPADVAGHTAVRDDAVAWDGTVWKLPFVIYNSSFAADDLLVNEYFDVVLRFGMKQ